jgi:hypothetical protein
MFKSRKIAWESWNALEEERYANDGDFELIEDDEEETEADGAMHPFMALSGLARMIETPLGAYNEQSLLQPSERWDCWIGYTNFDITKNIQKTIESIEGVEALKIIGRYTFFIGVGRMFSIKKVRHSIENVLCSYSKDEIFEDDDVYEAVSKVREQLDNEKFWTIMVTADGSIEYVTSNEINKTYLENVNKLIALKDKLGGIVLHSDDNNEVEDSIDN